MALTATQVGYTKSKLQQFTLQIVQFSAPGIGMYNPLPSPGAITWKPLPLLSPRFAFTTGDSVTIYGTDSVMRPTTAASSVTFAKYSGDGTVTDNGDKTCTVSYPGGESEGETIVTATVTHDGQTATGYATVYYASEGALNGYISAVEGLSGSLDNGEWQGELIYQGLWVASTEVPILVHSAHTWDGTTSTFGGYKRDANTFVLLVRDFENFKSGDEYYSRLQVCTPGYLLKMMPLNEMKFRDTAGSGYYSTTNLTISDVVYYILRECTNFHQYFNCSIWNQSSSTISNFNVQPDSNVWDVVRETSTEYNFGLCYFNRWSNLDIKPSPRARKTEWDAIAGPVYDGDNPLTLEHCLERTIHYRHDNPVYRLSLQAISPTLTTLEADKTSGSLGEAVEVSGLIAHDQTELDNWLDEYLVWLNRLYDLEVSLGMGHELNPGDLFAYNELSGAGDTHWWFCTDVSYEFDFTRMSWVRSISAEFLEEEEVGT